MEIYAPRVTFSVLWIERTYWIKSLQRKSYLSVFLSRVMRWVMTLWWFASKKTLTAEILIWRVKIRAIPDYGKPKSKCTVRSLLGMTGYLQKFIPRFASLSAPLREITEKDKPYHCGPEQEDAFQRPKDSITSKDTMAFFNPTRPIMLRMEASYNDGLSAWLFQTTDKGLQLVHCISCALTKMEQNYIKTEKDALVVKWAKEKFKYTFFHKSLFHIIYIFWQCIFNNFLEPIMLLLHHFYFAWTEYSHKCHIIIHM